MCKTCYDNSGSVFVSNIDVLICADNITKLYEMPGGGACHS